MKGFDDALISFASLVAEGNNAGEDQMLFVIPFTPGKYIIIKNCHSSHSNQSLADINRAGFANLVPMGPRESASPTPINNLKFKSCCLKNNFQAHKIRCKNCTILLGEPFHS